MITVSQLRGALSELSTDFDDTPIVVWLPGSIIDLGGADNQPIMGVSDPRGVLIEGDVREGSALSLDLDVGR